MYDGVLTLTLSNGVEIVGFADDVVVAMRGGGDADGGIARHH